MNGQYNFYETRDIVSHISGYYITATHNGIKTLGTEAASIYQKDAFKGGASLNVEIPACQIVEIKGEKKSSNDIDQVIFIDYRTSYEFFYAAYAAKYLQEDYSYEINEQNTSVHIPVAKGHTKELVYFTISSTGVSSSALTITLEAHAFKGDTIVFNFEY